MLQVRSSWINGRTFVQVLWCTSAVCVAARLTTSWLSLTPRVKNTDSTMRSDYDNDSLPDSHRDGLTLIINSGIHRVLLLSLTGPLTSSSSTTWFPWEWSTLSTLALQSQHLIWTLNTAFCVFGRKWKQHWQVLSIPITYSPYLLNSYLQFTVNCIIIMVANVISNALLSYCSHQTNRYVLRSSYSWSGTKAE